MGLDRHAEPDHDHWERFLFAVGDAPGLSHYFGCGDVNGDKKTDFIATRGHDRGVLWFEAPDWKPHAMHETIREPHCL